MKCIERVRRLAEAMGASVDVRERVLYVDAKPGYVWECNGCAVICEEGASYNQSWWSQACRDAIEQMSEGMSICTPDESAALEHEKDEPWTAPEGSPEHIAFPG